MLLLEPTAALQDFDLVAVRVLDEEECAERLAVVRHRLDVFRLIAGRDDAGPLGFEIVDDEGDMTVAVAKLVWLGAILVDRQLDLEVVLGVLEIDQREIWPVSAIGDLEAEARLDRISPSALRRARAPSYVWLWPLLSFPSRQSHGRVDAVDVSNDDDRS